MFVSVSSVLIVISQYPIAVWIFLIPKVSRKAVRCLLFLIFLLIIMLISIHQTTLIEKNCTMSTLFLFSDWSWNGTDISFRTDLTFIYKSNKIHLILVLNGYSYFYPCLRYILITIYSTVFLNISNSSMLFYQKNSWGVYHWNL